MKIFLLIFAYVPFVYSYWFEEKLKNTSIASIASTTIDFVPIIGNAKAIYEILSGEDIFTKKKLSKAEKGLSLLGVVPFGNYLKTVKHLKNGKKFLKAAQRAQKVGKMKNAINFAKASARAMKKAEFIQKQIKNAAKIAKFIFGNNG